MENEEPRPVKLINRRCLELKPYNCLICEKQAGKENVKSLGEEGVSAFGIRAKSNSSWDKRSL